MATGKRKGVKIIAGAASLDDFGVLIDDEKTRYRSYVTAASRLNPKQRAAWWMDIFRRDPEMLQFFKEDSGR
jgi:hypothetical protein